MRTRERESERQPVAEEEVEEAEGEVAEEEDMQVAPFLNQLKTK